MNSIERFLGTFAGTGSWHDAASKAGSYAIRQTNAARGDGFEVAFHHDFDDATVVDARFTMTWIAPHVFRVTAAGAPLGHGYVFDSRCHYHLNVGGKFIEVGYRADGDELEVFGSSSTNAEGNYTAWTERLRRTA
jgi:hypothetical protein